MKVAVRKTRRRLIREEGPDPIDVFVGHRLRERRLQQRLSQSAIAEELGVTFQAIQKYENGTIRIAASTLFRLCKILSVGPAYFFDGYDRSRAEVPKWTCANQTMRAAD